MSRSGDRDIQTIMLLSIKLKTVQDEIRTKQDEEIKLKSEIRALLKTEDQVEASSTETSTPRGGSLAEALVETFDAEPDVDFTSDMVRERIAARARSASSARMIRNGRGPLVAP